MKTLILYFALLVMTTDKLFAQTAIPLDSLVMISNWKFDRIQALLVKSGFKVEKKFEDPADVFADNILVCKQVVPPTEEGAREIVRTFRFNESNNSIHTFLHTDIVYTTSSFEAEEEIRKYLRDNAYYEERKEVYNNGKKRVILSYIREEKNRKVFESLKVVMKVKRPKPMRRHLQSR